MEDREKTRQDLLVRLRRIEGQVRGLHRMIEEGEECAGVVNQLAAVRGALDQVGFMLLSCRMAECVKMEGEEGQKALEDAMKLFLKLT